MLIPGGYDCLDPKSVELNINLSALSRNPYPSALHYHDPLPDACNKNDIIQSQLYCKHSLPVVCKSRLRHSLACVSSIRKAPHGHCLQSSGSTVRKANISSLSSYEEPERYSK